MTAPPQTLKRRLVINESPTPRQPTKAQIQRALLAFRKRSTIKGIALLLLDAVLYLVAVAGAIFAASVWVKFGCSLIIGLLTGLLFVIGHDACHQSLTPHRKLNNLIGRLAFLPSLHTYSLWDLGHNRIHHRYTNLKGYDYVFTPLTRAEYDGLCRWRRLLERLYRSPCGHGLFYFYEVWWKKMFFPGARDVDKKRAIYTIDSLLIAVWGSLLILSALLLPGTLSAGHLNLSALRWEALIFVFLLPQLIWNQLMGFLIYQHHTHPRVAWFSDYAEWSGSEQLRASVHISFPLWLGLLFHNIMEHTAHHAHMQIPLYELRGAQTTLQRQFSREIIEQPWSLKVYLNNASKCKLYDYDRHSWTDFDGQPTASTLTRTS
jgi:omega-6 fatty acid desaturase (delta-12 desaturase)